MVFWGLIDISQNCLQAAPTFQLHQTKRVTMFSFYLKKKTCFKEVLNGKAFQHSMFELRLQIVLYDQNLALTMRILDSNLV